MKKLLSVLVLVVAIMLSACQSAVSTQTGSEQGKFTGKRQTISTLEEYNAFIAETELPADFIHYSQIESLGTFRCFTYVPDNPTGLWYFYNLSDPNNSDIVFSSLFEVGEIENDDHQITSLPSGMTSMLKLAETTFESGRSYVYTRSGLDYCYHFEGGIYKMRWYDGNNCYQIESGERLDEYPIDGEETIVTRLLSLDEKVAAAAFTELKDAINKKS